MFGWTATCGMKSRSNSSARTQAPSIASVIAAGSPSRTALKTPPVRRRPHARAHSPRKVWGSSKICIQSPEAGSGTTAVGGATKDMRRDGGGGRKAQRRRRRRKQSGRYLRPQRRRTDRRRGQQPSGRACVAVAACETGRLVRDRGVILRRGYGTAERPASALPLAGKSAVMPSFSASRASVVDVWAPPELLSTTTGASSPPPKIFVMTRWQ